MDGKRFDELTRALTQPANRRRTLGGMAAGALTVFGLSRGETDAAGQCRNNGLVCGKNADCCSQTCLPKDRTGRRLCGQLCLGTGEICQSDDQCCGGVCNDYAGRCYQGCVPAGGETQNAYACCTPAAYINGSANDFICAGECVANGFVPIYHNAGYCCSRYVNPQTNQCQMPPP